MVDIWSIHEGPLMVEQALHSNFASVASYSASEASMRSAGARWKKPAEGRLMTASCSKAESPVPGGWVVGGGGMQSHFCVKPNFG